MLSHHLVQGLLAELQNWPEPVLRSHKDAKHPLHKLTFIADLGLQAGDPDVDEVIKRVLAHRSSEGPFMVLVNYPKHFGGSGEEQMVWALCNAPLVLYALVMFGFGEDSRVQEGGSPPPGPGAGKRLAVCLLSKPGKVQGARAGG